MVSSGTPAKEFLQERPLFGRTPLTTKCRISEMISHQLTAGAVGQLKIHGFKEFA